MKPRMLLFLFTVLILIVSGCMAHQEPPLELTSAPSNDDKSKQSSPSKFEKDTADTGEFQMFMDTWKLSGLIPASLVMTAENQDGVMQYFENIDESARDYVILLLQNISVGETTPANQYSDFDSGIYLNFCQFCLYDINLDGCPEFILKTGTCEADFWYTVYTIMDGQLIDCGGLSGGHAALYANGAGGFVRFAGHMGVYNITASTLEGMTLITKEIAAGELDFNKGEDYPELKEFGFGDCDKQLEFSGIPTLFLAPRG